MAKIPENTKLIKKPQTNPLGGGGFTSFKIILFLYVLEVPINIFICPINTNIYKYHCETGPQNYGISVF